jgi:hypothetical protein
VEDCQVDFITFSRLNCCHIIIALLYHSQTAVAAPMTFPSLPYSSFVLATS